MKHLYFLIVWAFCISLDATGQTGCPDCTVNLPPDLPEDTIFLSSAGTGFVNLAYTYDISFRMPKTTTPVHAVDSTTPAGFPISKMTIRGLANLPPGLSWEVSQTEFQTGDGETDGCVRICGVPQQTGNFLVAVQLTASVFGLNNDADFTFPITIYPEPDDSEPMVVYGNEGCGSTQVTFFNNIVSGGDSRFSYHWDFGNGDSSHLENPDPVVYAEPGTYIITYTATIDTAAYFLNTVSVTETDCSDFSLPPIASGKPDLYLIVLNADGMVIYRSAVKENADLPADFNMNVEIGQGSYRLKVFDDDTGLGGGDDFCGEIIFDNQAAGSFTQGNLSLDIALFHPVIRVTKTDTVIVHKIPETPVISPVDITRNCRDTLRLTSSVGSQIKWFFEGNFYSENKTIIAEEAGRYWIEYVDSLSGCAAVSDTVRVPELPIPPQGIFTNFRNELIIADSLPFAGLEVQWYRDNEILAGEEFFTLCATESGVYGVEIYDDASGCSSFYSEQVTLDPDFDCTVPVRDAEPLTAIGRIFPNPAGDVIYIEIKDAPDVVFEVQIYNPVGQLQQTLGVRQGLTPIHLTELPRGFYFLRISENGKIWQSQFARL